MEVSYNQLGKMFKAYGDLLHAAKEFRKNGTPPYKGSLARIILEEYLPKFNDTIPLEVQEHLDFDVEGLEKEVRKVLDR